MNSDKTANGQHDTGSNGNQENGSSTTKNVDEPKDLERYRLAPGETGEYWRMRYEKLLSDYTHLQQINQNLEDKLLNIAELFEKKKDELVANIEYEKSTLMADVNKLSTKLVDARIRLHDYEEKELMHASECDAPCHKNCPTDNTKTPMTNVTAKDQSFMQYDPNLV